MPTVFNSRLVGAVSVVSDNTHHRSSRQPISTVINKTKQTPTSIDRPAYPVLDSSTSTPVTNNNISPLPIIPEDSNLLSPLSPKIQSTTIDPPPASSTNLSPKQIQDILQKVTRHLELHGQITPELLKMLDTDKSPAKITTSTSPVNCPTLLSSDKMSNTTPASMRFTVQQLSRYFGFRSF